MDDIVKFECFFFGYYPSSTQDCLWFLKKELTFGVKFKGEGVSEKGVKKRFYKMRGEKKNFIS